MGDNNQIMPGQGGVTSPEYMLRTYVEYLNDNKYDIMTVEIHNPNVCNVNSVKFKHLNDMGKDIYPQFYESMYLDGNKTIIDMTYLKQIKNINYETTMKDYEYHYILFDGTRDLQRPKGCEVRFFGKLK